MGKKSLFLAVSLVLSGLLLFQIFSQNTINQWPRLLATAYGPEGPCTWIFSTDHQ
jgi:hypothetical protein